MFVICFKLNNDEKFLNNQLNVILHLKEVKCYMTFERLFEFFLLIKIYFRKYMNFQ